MWRLLGLCIVVLVGCIHDELVACPGDTVCPVGLQCDTVHGGCISADQSTACIGMADQTQCSAGDVHGYCLDQICIDPGCGNHVIESDELCDDGNHVDGDGCSATCLSRERCGDGARDLRLGEECDDGNLQSRDGCDSQCRTETVEWTVDGLGPTFSLPEHAVYDPVRGETVIISDTYVWGWNGSRWHVIADGAPVDALPYVVAYDPARSSLVILSKSPETSDIADPMPPYSQLDEWDGTTWTHSVITNAPGVYSIAVTYDPVRDKLFVVGSSSTGVVTGEIDVASHSWSGITMPSQSSSIYGFDVAFDTKRGVVVVVITAPNPVVAEWNGTNWTTSATTMGAAGNWSLVYSPVVEKVIAIGTDSTAGTTSPVQAWTGTAWVDLATLPSRVSRPSVTFDSARQVCVVFGGGDPPDQIIEGPATSWTVLPRQAPAFGPYGACAFELSRNRLVCTGNLYQLGHGETWSYDGTWTLLDSSSPGGIVPNAITYDPIREAIVGWLPSGLVAFVDSSWQLIETDIESGWFGQAIAYDPIGRQIVAVGRPFVFGVASTVRLAPDNHTTSFESIVMDRIAFDARNQTMMGIGLLSDSFHLVGDGWQPTIGPGSTYVPVSNARRGTLEFFTPDAPVVEQIGSQWHEEPSGMPEPIRGGLAMNPTTGELYILGARTYSRFLLHRKWISSTPFEDCSPGASTDADGDGLQGCSDPDCWTTCTPACPPYVSCP